MKIGKDCLNCVVSIDLTAESHLRQTADFAWAVVVHQLTTLLTFGPFCDHTKLHWGQTCTTILLP